MQIERSNDNRLVIVSSPGMLWAVAPLPTLAMIVAVLTGGIPLADLTGVNKGYLALFAFLQSGLLAIILPYSRKASFDSDLVRRELTWRRRHVRGMLIRARIAANMLRSSMRLTRR